MNTRYDECCPHCEASVSCYSKWESTDYEPTFFIDCEKCGKMIEVRVQQVPEFSTRKPTCQYCGKVEIERGSYCGKCQKKLNELSEFNRQRAESAK